MSPKYRSFFCNSSTTKSAILHNCATESRNSFCIQIIESNGKQRLTAEYTATE